MENENIKTVKLPMTKEAMFKLALSLQELSQEDKDGYVNIETVSIDKEKFDFVFMKSWEK
jgi:hypothetical protein